MIRFPNAKVNLTLRVGNKRKDGFHEIQSLFYPIPFYDILEIVPSKKIRFLNTGLQIPGNPASNLCLKAYDLLKTDHDIPPVFIHIHKQIPMGAGLGGGSSDATETLILLNQIFDLGLEINELEKYALKIGSDCPYFLLNKPAMVTGRGEIIEAVDFKIQEKYMAVVDPRVHVQTSIAYNKLARSEAGNELGAQDLMELQSGNFGNDFQDVVEKVHPELTKIRAYLSELGASYAGMTGSGACYFGLFKDEPRIDRKINKSFNIRVLQLN